MKKIIFLEDEDVLAHLYEKKLKKAGFEVYWAKKFEDVEKLINSVKADVVLLDNAICGEEKTGLDILPIVRKALPKAKIVILSNFSGIEFEQQADEAGADNCWVKIDMSPSSLPVYIKHLLKEQ